MPDLLPKFERPPLVETALSAQFGPLAKFRTAHAGVFRERYLGKEWPDFEQHPRIDDLFERFGSNMKWGPAGPLFRLSPATESQRTQIVRTDKSVMIQVQDSRFIYNWRKGESATYPSYRTTRSEFGRYYGLFLDFLKSAALGEIEENQWEITYVNHLHIDDLWRSSGDWQSIFPWLRSPQESLPADRAHIEWDLALPEERGRLHVSLSSGRISTNGTDVLILDLTARGSAAVSQGMSVVDGFEIGHAAIVRAFAEMTSERAHAKWGRTQ